MTAEFWKKNIYQKTNLKGMRLGIKKVLGKSEIGWRQMLVSSHSSENFFLVITVKKYTL